MSEQYHEHDQELEQRQMLIQGMIDRTNELFYQGLEPQLDNQTSQELKDQMDANFLVQSVVVRLDGNPCELKRTELDRHNNKHKTFYELAMLQTDVNVPTMQYILDRENGEFIVNGRGLRVGENNDNVSVTDISKIESMAISLVNAEVVPYDEAQQFVHTDRGFRKKETEVQSKPKRSLKSGILKFIGVEPTDTEQ